MFREDRDHQQNEEYKQLQEERWGANYAAISKLSDGQERLKRQLASGVKASAENTRHLDERLDRTEEILKQISDKVNSFSSVRVQAAAAVLVAIITAGFGYLSVTANKITTKAETNRDLIHDIIEEQEKVKKELEGNGIIKSDTPRSGK